ncbi:MAG: CBS domain-containing protein, partial [Bryobacteraceae bacterium]
LLILDGERVAGVMSERDYARKIILKARSSKETRVDEIMTSQPITITAACAVSEAMRIMTEHRMRHLPVVSERGTVLGMISIGDLVKWIINSQEETIEHLHSYISGRA